MRQCATICKGTFLLSILLIFVTLIINIWDNLETHTVTSGYASSQGEPIGSHNILPHVADIAAASKSNQSNTGDNKPTRNSTAHNCRVNVPCEYEDEVHLRIIVMSFNRAASLQLCLDALQSVVLDGDKAALEIWIDRDKSDKVHQPTVDVAKNFRWSLGRSRVTVQEKHVGIYGQWIDTWRPHVGSKEIAIILEDDIDVSPYVYRWAKAAHKAFDHREDVCGYSLSEIDLIKNNGAPFIRPNDIAFMFRRFGTFGFSPHPKVYRKFQDWFHKKRSTEKSFKPYVQEDYIFTSWYKIFEKENRQDGMWSMWFEYYTHHHKLYAMFPNIGKHYKEVMKINWTNATFAFHRQEKGLHFGSKQLRKDSTKRLVTVWSDDFIRFPSKVPIFDYNSKMVGHAEPKTQNSKSDSGKDKNSGNLTSKT